MISPTRRVSAKLRTIAPSASYRLGEALTTDSSIDVLFVYNSNALATTPNQTLVRRGLVKRCEGAGLVRWHMTAEGTAQAEAEDRAREERRAVARANRGSNAMIG